MMDLYMPQQTVGKPALVHGKVQAVIQHVADHETHEKQTAGVISHQLTEQEFKPCRQRQADNARHQIPVSVLREVMVITMNDKYKTLPPGRMKFHMEQKAVHDIFKEKPCQQASRDQFP